MYDLDQLHITDEHGFAEVNALLYRYGFTDGLPVVPPTPARVEAMLAGRDPARVLARLEPAKGEATQRKLAQCAVLAGCPPEIFPVLAAAVQAVAQPAFNLLGVQTTTGNAAVLLLVHGPVAQRAGFNAGSNAFGPGVRANATVGRALALALRLIGGAVPGRTDMATMGQPGKYTWCAAEHESASPWGPLGEARGLAPGASGVTVVAAAGMVEIVDAASRSADSLLTTIAHSMAIAGTVGAGRTLGSGEALLLLAPEHARTLARSCSRAEVQARLHERARLPLAHLPPETRERLAEGFRETGGLPEALPVAERPEDILLAVVGGPGQKSAYVPTWGGGTRAVTHALEH